MIISNPTKALQTKIKVENIDLPSLSSYSGKFIGKTIENGKLSVTLDYDIKKAQLTSTNNIKIKDIKLGQTVQSKDAINAPIGLAIALLEDSDGYIDLDIPIDGDINSPNFHFSDVILDVITNTIVGIVSAPFKFLAMMIGLDGQDISNLEFDYGSYLISVAQQEKLDNIVKAFKKRPNLKLKINTTYVQNEDTIGLQERKFQEKYRQILTVKDNFDTIYKQTQTIFIKEFGKENFKELKGENKEKYQTMLKLLKNNIKITTEDLILLAKNRADNIKIYLVEKKLDQARILIDENIKTSTKDLKIDKALILFEIEAK
jgi:outer membrane protein OmpA-like peptidoglycan-associated protein